VIDGAAPPGAAPSAQEAPARSAGIRATPLVRRIAAELRVDLEDVRGTGPQGRITEDDVRGAASPSPTEGRREPIRGVRRQMFEHLARAHREIAPVTWVEECDFSDVDLKRLLPLVLKAAAESLQEFPELNARIEGDELVHLDRFDIGVAVQTEQGLVVPVVRGCAERSVDELAADVKRLAEAAHAGRLAPEELRDGTFTVTSAGRSAGLFTTPLVNHPQVAILGIHRIAERPVVHAGEIAVRSMGNVSVTFDHRVVDGKRAADFGLAVIARLEA
jgi:pyruvate/2-oxoglutarate dehydrogenase complex dihydrolipoamide acyltransferase (E2) component